MEALCRETILEDREKLSKEAKGNYLTFEFYFSIILGSR